ncbi:MAG: DEAD/DEAH box helicase, partial [Sulfurospirillaceae bacterium]
RTGKAGLKGVAITLCTPMEYQSLQRIAKKVGTNIEHKVLPTLNELKESKLKDLANGILQIPLNESANTILSSIEEETDIRTVALKAISFILKENSAHGPETIGLDPQAFAKILKRIKPRRRDGSRRRDSSRRTYQKSSSKKEKSQKRHRR